MWGEMWPAVWLGTARTHHRMAPAPAMLPEVVQMLCSEQLKLWRVYAKKRQKAWTVPRREPSRQDITEANGGC